MHRILISALLPASLLLTGCVAPPPARTATPSPPSATRTPEPTPNVAGTVEAAVAATVAALPTPTPFPTPTSPPATATPVPIPVAKIAPASGLAVPVASDLPSFLEATTALIERNATALARLRAEGRYFEVAQGVEVEILERSSPLTRVRVLSGSFTGKVGVLDAKHLCCESVR